MYFPSVRFCLLVPAMVCCGGRINAEEPAEILSAPSSISTTIETRDAALAEGNEDWAGLQLWRHSLDRLKDTLGLETTVTFTTLGYGAATSGSGWDGLSGEAGLDVRWQMFHHLGIENLSLNTRFRYRGAADGDAPN